MIGGSGVELLWEIMVVVGCKISSRSVVGIGTFLVMGRSSPAHSVSNCVVGPCLMGPIFIWCISLTVTPITGSMASTMDLRGGIPNSSDSMAKGFFL